jgi:hypothetical protein
MLNCMGYVGAARGEISPVNCGVEGDDCGDCRGLSAVSVWHTFIDAATLGSLDCSALEHAMRFAVNASLFRSHGRLRVVACPSD